MQSIKSFFEELKNTPDYRFNPLIAAEYGERESIMLQNLLFWIKKNKSRKHNRRDGRTWTYNSHNSFAKIFYFWSIRQIGTILKSLIKQGVLIAGNYNKNKYDRTTWYAFKNESEWLETSVETNVETRSYVSDKDDLDPKIKALFDKSECVNAKRLLSKLTKFQQTEAINALNKALKFKVIKNRVDYLFGIIKNFKQGGFTPKNEKLTTNPVVDAAHLAEYARRSNKNNPRIEMNAEELARSRASGVEFFKNRKKRRQI